MSNIIQALPPVSILPLTSCTTASCFFQMDPVLQVSDLDGTMVGTTPEADEMTSAFTRYWEGTAALCNSVLVYNTGRSLGQFKGLLQEKAGVLAVPDALITAVGTKVGFLRAFPEEADVVKGAPTGGVSNTLLLHNTGRFPSW